jgi:hypothetical protein
LVFKNFYPASPAVAFASKVLPVPGGPAINAPLGILAPKSLYFLGFFKKSTNSVISYLASSNPATSLNLVLILVSTPKTLAPNIFIYKKIIKSNIYFL